MDSRERMRRAMRGETPDRVPVMCQLSLGHYFLNSNLPPHRIWFTSEGFAEALVALRERYRFDGILVNLPGRDPRILDRIVRVEDRPDGEVVHWMDGSRTLLPRDDNPQHEPAPGSLARPRFESFDPERDLLRRGEWASYLWGTCHTPWLPEPPPGPEAPIADAFGRTLDIVRSEAGDRVSVHGEVFSPLTHFMELFGYQEALIGLATDPVRAEAILEGLAATAGAWALAQAARGVDALLVSSAFAGAGFISRPMYERFVLPGERRVVELLRREAPGLPVYTHTCGKLRDRLDLLEATGTDGIDTLDPPPLGDTPLAEAKRRVGSRLFIKGNINSVAWLDDDPEAARRRALDTLRVGRPGGRYILSTACAVAPRVEPAKLELLADLAEEFGRYPDSDAPDR